MKKHVFPGFSQKLVTAFETVFFDKEDKKRKV